MTRDRSVTASGARTIGRRRRQLRWTVGILVAATLVATGIGVVVYRTSRPGTYRPGEEHPEITRTLARFVPPDAPKPQFSDVTVRAGLGGFRAFAGARTSQLPEDMGSGAAWGDVDNDGDQDLFLVSAGGPLGGRPEDLAPSQLYENLGNGTFRLVPDFPDTRIIGMAAAFGDYDGDGWLDLVVTGHNTIRLFHSEHGRFVRDTRFPDQEGFWAGAAWGDLDNDGRPDLYICGYVQYEPNETDRTRLSAQYGTAVPFTLNPSSYPPERNLLFHNNGNGTFTEVAGQLGVDNRAGRSLSALWHDFDDDGWLDLYVANDLSDNKLYMNRHGTFEDVSAAASVADYRGAMGLAAGDWNRDGDDDLFITHWIGQGDAFYDSLLADLSARRVSGPARAAPAGISPQLAAGRLQFTDIASSVGLGQISLPMIGWGAEFADFDGDGWLDLAVTNGSTFETEQAPRELTRQLPFLFWNRRGEYFHDLAPLNDALTVPHVGRGLAVADYDNDGAMDILFVLRDAGVMLLHNAMQTGHWLEARLRSRPQKGSMAPGFADGATVIAHVGGVGLRRTVTSASYLSQSSRVVHFGLGAASQLDTLEVRWLGGKRASYASLDADAIWEITEDNPTPRRIAPYANAASSDVARPALDAPAAAISREQLMRFWEKQRAAMNAMKVDDDIPRAIALFREALALNPTHEDSRYYLGNCLAMTGDVAGALSQLEELTRINPQSLRAYRQWGAWRAMSATSAADLAAAEKALQKGLAINPEETGTLLLLGEIALLSGEAGKAEERLSLACRTNERAAGGFFLRGYVAWRRGDEARARELLVQARRALGESWVPKGATSEGDVRQTLHTDATPLSRFWDEWDGTTTPRSFAALDGFLIKRAKDLRISSPVRHEH